MVSRGKVPVESSSDRVAQKLSLFRELVLLRWTLMKGLKHDSYCDVWRGIPYVKNSRRIYENLKSLVVAGGPDPRSPLASYAPVFQCLPLPLPSGLFVSIFPVNEVVSRLVDVWAAARHDSVTSVRLSTPSSPTGDGLLCPLTNY